VRCDDSEPGKIDIDAAMNCFVSGQVMVSYGLLVEIKVNDQYRSGELATGQGIAGDQFRVDVRVLGPHWCQASQIQLWANGQPMVVAAIPQTPAADLPVGVKWSGGWTLTKPAHDVHLVAIATGPGIDGLYWKTAKPYQPTSPDWRAMTIGCSGAVWLDADDDGRRTPAREYAQRALAAAGQDYAKLVGELSKYDEAVAAQAAYLLQRSGATLETQPLIEALERATPATAAGFQAFREAWRENEIARARP
jgi:hypothetical protein